MFLVMDDWNGYFGGGPVQSLLPRPTSVNFPLLLVGGGALLRGPTPFRFEKCG